jgi:tetratricopeptide (TPR) repeat protein
MGPAVVAPLLLATIGAAAAAQPARDSLPAHLLLVLADSALAHGRFDSAMTLYRQSAREYHLVHVVHGEAHAAAAIARAFSRQSQDDSAKHYYRYSVSVLHGTAPGEAVSALQGWGDVLARERKIDSALLIYRKADSAARLTGDAKLRRRVAYHVGAWAYEPKPDSSLLLLGRALSESRAAHDTALERDVENTIGLAYRHINDIPQAFAHLRRSAELARVTRAPTAEANALTNISDVFRYEVNMLDSAIDYQRRALDVHGRTGNIAGAIEVHQAIAAAMNAAGQFREARAEFRIADSLANLSGNVLARDDIAMHLAWLFSRDGHSDSAIAILPRLDSIAEARKDLVMERYVANAMGSAYEQIDSIALAKRWYEHAAESARHNANAAGEAVFLRNIGVMYFNRKLLDSAIAYYRRSTDIAARGGVRVEEATSSAMLANAYAADGRQLDSVLVIYRRAIEQQRRVGNGPGEAHLLNALGDIFDKLQRFDESSAVYRRALRVARAAHDRAEEFDALWNLAYSNSANGESADSTFLFLRQALPLARALRDSAGIAVVLHHLGDAWIDVSRPDSALFYYRAGLEMSRAIGDSDLAVDFASIAMIFNQLRQPDSAFAYLRDARETLRRRSPRNYTRLEGVFENFADAYRYGSRPDLALAAVYYDSAATALDSLRVKLGGDVAQTSVSDLGYTLFDNWTPNELAMPGAEPRARALAGLAVSERGRSRALLRLLNRSSGGDRPGVGELVAAAHTFSTRVAAGDSITKLALHDADALLVYHLTGDTLIAWLARRGGSVTVAYRSIGWDSLATLVQSARLGIAGRGGRTRAIERLESADRGLAVDSTIRGRFVTLSDLSKILLPDAIRSALPDSGEIVIIPHGPLAALPFAALPLSSSESLGSRFGIRYAPSIATLAEIELGGEPLTAAEIRARPGDALIVANPKMPSVQIAVGESVQLPPLPGAAVEGRWLEQQLPGATQLTGALATTTAVSRYLDRATIAHFATHGYAYAESGRERDSFIALSPDDPDRGLMSVAEVLDKLPAFRAELVVLSACQTGLGTQFTSEGTVGIQRAFLAKGVRSVLVSLWNVSDEATALLMRHFYTHWLRDADTPSKAEALRRAQNDVRRDPRFANPRYWAAFQLVGGR